MLLSKEEEDAVYRYILSKTWGEMSDREKDVLIQLYVFDEDPHVNIHTKLPTSDKYPPNYSTKWEAMGLLLTKLREKGQSWMKENFGYYLQQSTIPECYGADRDHIAIGEMMFKMTPDAVAKASLRSLGIDLKEEVKTN